MINKKCKNDYIKPLFINCNPNFPFIEETFDSITDWQTIEKIGGKVDEIILFINTILEQKISEYINEKFNDMVIDSMYEASTETLILYMHQNQPQNN